MEIIILIIVFGLAILPVALFRYFRKNKKTKEERRAETITALSILAILFLIVFVRQSVLNNQKENIIQNDSTSQSSQ